MHFRQYYPFLFQVRKGNILYIHVLKTNDMQSTAATPEAFLDELCAERKHVMTELRTILLQNLPNGFTETMSHGMISYVVPHALYPKGYHCNPKQPLPFLSIASQKNFIAVYHMVMYADDVLLNWFKKAYSRQCNTSLDMGKSCIRFKKTGSIPLQLIGALAAKMTPAEWVALYENQIKRKS